MRLKPWIIVLCMGAIGSVDAGPLVQSQNAPNEAAVAKASCAVPVEDVDSAALMGRAATCLDQRDSATAVVLYHAGLLRLSALAQADPVSTERKALIAAFRLVLERPLIGWATGHIPQWILLMGDAMAWDQSRPFPEGDAAARKAGLTAEQWTEVRFQDRMKLMVSINDLSRDRERIYLARTQAKAPVRDPAWTTKRSIEVALQVAQEAASTDKAHGSGHSHNDNAESPGAERGTTHPETPP